MYAGKYYSIMAGGGFLGKVFGGVAKVAGAVARIPGVSTALRALPGIGTVATLAGPAIGIAKKAAGAISGAKAAGSAWSGTRALVPYTGGAALAGPRGFTLGRGLAAGAAGAGAAAIAMSGGRSSGRRYRRMNALNPKAANRAIRRIKAVRKLTRAIESQLPKRACSCRSASPFARRRRKAA